MTYLIGYSDFISHTDTHTYQHLHKSNFKKPGMCVPGLKSLTPTFGLIIATNLLNHEPKVGIKLLCSLVPNLIPYFCIAVKD